MCVCPALIPLRGGAGDSCCWRSAAGGWLTPKHNFSHLYPLPSQAGKLNLFCCRTCSIHLFVKLLVIPHWWNYRGLDCGDIFSQYVSIPFTNEHEIRCYLLVPQFIFRLFIHRICFKTSYFCNHFLTFKIETISKWSNFITEFLLLAVLEQSFWCARYCKNLIATLYVLIDLCLCFHLISTNIKRKVYIIQNKQDRYVKIMLFLLL